MDLSSFKLRMVPGSHSVRGLVKVRAILQLVEVTELSWTSE